MAQRNRAALCELANYYDQKEKFGLPFYDQAHWGFSLSPDASRHTISVYFSTYVAGYVGEDQGTGRDPQVLIDEIQSYIQGENTCFTYGCVAGNTAAAFGYEGRRSEIDAPGVYQWNRVRPRGSDGEYEQVSRVAQRLLGLDDDEAEVMFGSNWKPKEGLSMGSVLRRLAGGAHILHVSSDGVVMANYYRFVGEPDFSKAYVDAVADQIEARRQKKLEEAEFV